MKDNFQNKAPIWDKGSTRVNGAKTIADAIKKKIKLNSSMDIMDFGVGTGLLGFEVASLVNKVLGVDISDAMLAKLREKNTTELNIEPCNIDIVANPIDAKFNGIISSMTLHHVENLELFFKTIKNNLTKEAFIAIADLETEDGSFHSDNEGVFHFGFDKDALCQIVSNCGFSDISFENINTINKPHRDFKVFLLTARVKIV